jgi:hypothetical protein
MKQNFTVRQGALDGAEAFPSVSSTSLRSRAVVLPVRQNFALLISKGSFGDSKSDRFQRLSASISRISIAAATNADPLGAGKDRQPRPSGPL